ncbi:hypothetical protein CS542_02960 [Pedobacter sp. IW39]|nr:hypothetical protein CS542_02960 [Pedobacter sp. IW39]
MWMRLIGYFKSPPIEIDSLLHQLDPHSVYHLPPVKNRSQSDMLEGNFQGIGIEYYILKDTLLVTNYDQGQAGC